uniref:Uncharacterized protein TCIL3000_9_880 n=1 Tax=Trypanosoma congolense (strain IL3000) TaxID=1068625 RepID=G0UTH9_TRYCI|nr:unnamed protein product [Trypanosoma congolense IL3000]
MAARGYGRGRGGGARSVARKSEKSTTSSISASYETDRLSIHTQLEELQRHRESIERRLEELDVRVYDLETIYLRQHVELGGCLFDGFGLERQQLWCAATTAASPARAPAASSTATGGVIDTLPEDRRIAAYRDRLRSFTPNDRVFTASSVGALSTVERLKTLEAAQEESGRARRTRKRTRGKEW